MPQDREKFLTQVDSEILSAVRTLAQKEGLTIQALGEEALADLIAKRKSTGPRPQVMGTYLASLEPYNELYKKFAK